jgi:hypothetical protein
VRFNVAADPVSFHIPLHRTFAGFLHAAIMGKSKQDLHALHASVPEHWADMIIEHPLRMQVLASQILANLWVRNGNNMQRQVCNGKYGKQPEYVHVILTI